MPELRRLGELLAGLADPGSAASLPIEGLSLDSRRVQPGDLFLACAGTRAHGLEHVGEAIDRGAVAVAWEPVRGRSFDDSAGVAAVAVEQLAQRVGLIADRFYGHPSGAMTVVGVTGTDGKTSVSQLLAQALDQDVAPCGLIGTLGYGRPGELTVSAHTTPDPVSLQRIIAALRAERCRWLSMEVSSHALDQGRVNGVAFDLGIFTNLSREHLDYHRTMEAYAAAKRRLLEWPGLDCAIVNLDDPYGRDFARQLGASVPVLGYGLIAGRVEGVERVAAGDTRFGPWGVWARVSTPWGEGELESPLIGRFNLYNLLAVLAALLRIGVDLPEALLRLRTLEAVPGRMQAIGGGEGPLVIVDYAHTPAALAQALEAVREHCAGRLICVFGCGGERDRGKRPLMAAAVERLADRCIITDDNPRGEDAAGIVADMLAGLEEPERARVEHDRAAAIALALSEAGPGDAVLIAGKGHETVQLIGTQARPFDDLAVARALLQEAAS
jgi:UDP-N-acetylmuramoyl-L-alanyl-D-glutamate--2,6-diaminopimelate ligase